MIKRYTLVGLLMLGALCLVAPAISQPADQKKQDPGQQKKKAALPPLPGAGTGGNSPHATISTAFGGSRTTGSLVTISYGRPTSIHPRNLGAPRKIWGDLVKWDQPDRMGADEATTLINQHPLVFGATTIPPGTYTLYIVPSETGTSRLGISRNVGKWGVPVDDKSDVARVDLTKEPLDPRVEQLTLAIENTSAPGGELTGRLRIMWENTQFSVPFTVKK